MLKKDFNPLLAHCKELMEELLRKKLSASKSKPLTNLLLPHLCPTFLSSTADKWSCMVTSRVAKKKPRQCTYAYATTYGHKSVIKLSQPTSLMISSWLQTKPRRTHCWFKITSFLLGTQMLEPNLHLIMAPAEPSPMCSPTTTLKQLRW